MGKLLILLGVILIAAGVMMTYRISLPGLGKLPGDISFKGDNFHIYIPLTTCLIISLILSLLFYFFSRR